MAVHQSAVSGKDTKELIKMNCTLRDIKTYSHPGVINRYKKEFPDDAENAEQVFKDLMIFFWGSEKHELDRHRTPSQELDFVYIMDEEMKSIDQIWHIFLLYTKDYMDFCDKYFGKYIHHLPDIVPTMPQSSEAFEKNLERFLSYNYDLFGEEIIKRWFGE